MNRITQAEWKAIGEAIGFRLAGDTEDIEDKNPHVREILESAHAKVSERIRD